MYSYIFYNLKPGHELVYSINFTEIMKEEIMAMCRRDVMDILVPRWDDDNRLIGSPIIELEFEKDTLGLYIIIGGECIQLRMK